MKKIRTVEAPKHPNVKIAVRNFGPIAEGTVDLRPLTVFVGPSNTGKPISPRCSMHCTGFLSVFHLFLSHKLRFYLLCNLLASSDMHY